MVSVGSVSRLALIAGLAVLSAGQAKAQTPLPSWTGLHGGVNFGVGGGRYFYPGNGEQTVEGAIQSDSTEHRSSGVFGGFQIGYDHQISNNIVVGVEADFQRSTIMNNYSRYDWRNDMEWDKRKSSANYFGTIRGRLGYSFGSALVYLTGGAAYAKVGFYDEEGGDVDPTDPNGVEPTTYQGGSGLRWGWAFGAGVDYMVDARWRVRAEYLLADFNKLPALDHAGGAYGLKTRFHTFRLGVNYLLWAPEQAGTQAAPAFDPVWRGFTLGVVGGLGGDGVHVNYSEAGEGTRTSSSFGFLGGVSLGYDHRFANKVILGGEADFQFANIESYRRKFDPAGASEPGQAPDAPGSNGLTLRVENYATFRGRLGYDMGRFAPFVAGGLAVGNVKFGQFDPSDKVATLTHRGNLQTGFTLGAGFEYALSQRWTFKGEYAYVNLGRFGAAEVDGDAFKTQIQFSTIRAGLKYRF